MVLATLEHPALVRIAHWLQAPAIIIMIGSGWRIYNSVPIFGKARFQTAEIRHRDLRHQP
jgi:thiosulfate reductase cytochrome b subunit